MTVDDSLEALRSQAMSDAGIPSKVREMLQAGAALEEIRLDAQGRWYHEGEPFVHQGLMRLFYRSLHCTKAGTWHLHIAPYTYPIVVEDTGRFIVRLLDAAPALVGIEPDGRHTPLDPAQFVSDGDCFLAARLPDGQLARCIQAAYHDLLNCVGLDTDGAWYLDWHDKRWPLLPRSPRDEAQRPITKGAGV